MPSSLPLRPLQWNIKMAGLLLCGTVRPIFLLPGKRWVNLEFGEGVGVAVKECKWPFGFLESSEALEPAKHGVEPWLWH